MQPEHVEKMIKEYGVGGIIFLYKSDPVKQMMLARKFQAASKVPLMITQDAEWGLSMRLDIDPKKVVRYPRNMTLGAIQDEEIVFEVAKEIGNQCAAIGVHMNFAPVVDVNNNKANPVIHDRSFGDNPDRVARLACLFARGLQAAGVLACAKHFPGHGDTNIDSHVELPTIKHNRNRLDAVELAPFRALARNGIDAIMHAHLNVPALDETGTPSSLSHKIVTQLLQQELGYKGLNITDGLGMDAVRKKYAPGELELAAFLAGNDILLCPLDVPNAVSLIEREITSGRVSEDDLNRRVLKILSSKKWAFEQQKGLNENIEDIEKYLTRKEAYELQRRAYRAAVTLIPQQGEISLNKSSFDSSCILQMGKLPENAFIGLCNQHEKAVLSCSSALSPQEFNACVAQAQKKECVVIALGEMNKFINKNFGISENVSELMRQLRAMDKKIHVILFGTPYSIELFPNANSFIVAYEDTVTSQHAVVDVLRGDLKPSGVLPITI
jgi:beta-glucosidase-like glycosyl hydrolase